MERRLAAILAADVVGYSRLIRADEEGTIAVLKALRAEIIDPKLSEHNGRIVKLMGDGFLVEFGSVVDALRSAAEMQRAMTERNADLPEGERILLRVGINLGDIVVEGEDILGDGVNVAARLEELAEPGGIYVPRKVFEEVRDKLDVGFEFLGDQSVKNIKKPIPVYRVLLEPQATGRVIGERRPRPAPWQLGAVTAVAVTAVAVAGFYFWPSDQAVAPVSNDFCEQRTALAVPDKPSVAVLPFDNLSGDAKQDAFSDGLTEDIITTLANVSDIFVIARNSTFTYKGKPVKVQQVAEELGVRYVLEGSVQQSGERLRVNAQLVDAESGNHLWAERYDRSIGDVFAVRDEITFNILTALQVELTEGEQARMVRRGTTNLEAYQLLWKSVEEFQRFDMEGNAKARTLAKRVIELDADWSSGWLMLGWTYLQGIQYGADRTESIRLGSEYAERAFQLDDTNPHNSALLAYAALIRGEPERAVELGRKAVALGPNQGDVYGLLGLYLNAAGRPEEAIPAVQKAMRLSPYYPTFYLIQLGRAYRLAGRHEEAILEYKKLACRLPDSFYSYLGQALSYARLGREKEARAAVAELLRVRPDYSLGIHKGRATAKGTELTRELDNLRKAGVPE